MLSVASGRWPMQQASWTQRVRHTLARYFSVKPAEVAQTAEAQLGARKAVEASERNVAAGKALIAELQTLDAIIRPDRKSGSSAAR